MADKAPIGTVPANPALVNLKEREKVLVDKLATLDKADANEFQRAGFDLSAIKHRNQLQLAEIRKAIEKETK